MRFTVEDIEFDDDEATEFGADTDYALNFDSGNDRVQLADVTNATFVHFPRNLGTDLVRGHFAETVDEGKALADDGETYDSIQDAVDAASSWVKVGPGTFNETLDISTSGLTLVGSGEKTIVNATGTNTINPSATDITVRDINLRSPTGAGVAIQANDGGSGLSAINCHMFGGRGCLRSDAPSENASGWTVYDCHLEADATTILSGPNWVVTNNLFEPGNAGISDNGDDIVVANNVMDGSKYGGQECFQIANNDHTIGGNIIKDFVTGIQSQGTDNIFYNNRLISCETDIDDTGTNTVLDGNNTN